MQFEVLTAEKASMVSGLEAKDVQMESMQQEHSSVQTQLLLCQEHVSQLQADLLKVQLLLYIVFKGVAGDVHGLYSMFPSSFNKKWLY